ncbi:MAG: hypothetical protein ACSHX9_09835 [Luteolibacter sp.]
MAIEIPEGGSFEAFAIIVDINGFTRMVSKGDDTGLMAQFIRDVLAGAVEEIENNEGAIVAYMGDAILGIIPPGENVASACYGIAKDLDGQCGYISKLQRESPDNWPYAPGGPSLKISVEYGELNVSSLTSTFLGTQSLIIGNPINYAARISTGGTGNRCNVGPIAASMAPFTKYDLKGPNVVDGKNLEGQYEYYQFPMDEVWIEGPIEEGGDTYWD